MKGEGAGSGPPVATRFPLPLITTPSAKRTRDGLFFSFAFFAALRNADFRLACNKSDTFLPLAAHAAVSSNGTTKRTSTHSAQVQNHLSVCWLPIRARRYRLNASTLIVIYSSKNLLFGRLGQVSDGFGVLNHSGKLGGSIMFSGVKLFLGNNPRICRQISQTSLFPRPYGRMSKPYVSAEPSVLIFRLISRFV